MASIQEHNIRDNDKWLNTAELGKEQAKRIYRWFEKRNLKIPTDRPCVAVGCGYAYAEMALFDDLSIPPQNVTYVDRDMGKYTYDRFIEKGSRAYEQDLFDFLSEHHEDFLIIYALGLEYVLQGNRLSEFLELLSIRSEPSFLIMTGNSPKGKYGADSEQRLLRKGWKPREREGLVLVNSIYVYSNEVEYEQRS